MVDHLTLIWLCFEDEYYMRLIAYLCTSKANFSSNLLNDDAFVRVIVSSIPDK